MLTATHFKKSFSEKYIGLSLQNETSIFYDSDTGIFYDSLQALKIKGTENSLKMRALLYDCIGLVTKLRYISHKMMEKTECAFRHFQDNVSTWLEAWGYEH